PAAIYNDSKRSHQNMGQYERTILMAEDQLTEYSSTLRKIEKLRVKIGLSVSREEQQKLKETLLAELPSGGLARIVEGQRQTAALPFWGIAGLGLLLGIAMAQPLDFLFTLGGGAIAYKIQQWGWRMQAKRLVLATLEEIDDRIEKRT
ncbi:MAG: hypothetical protein SWY16_05185, partial [Cyanobacteriota bacterium]|nr:hypothetical protein [Cyanobacteriota bacterium]